MKSSSLCAGSFFGYSVVIVQGLKFPCISCVRMISFCEIIPKAGVSCTRKVRLIPPLKYVAPSFLCGSSRSFCSFPVGCPTARCCFFYIVSTKKKVGHFEEIQGNSEKETKTKRMRAPFSFSSFFETSGNPMLPCCSFSDSSLTPKATHQSPSSLSVPCHSHSSACSSSLFSGPPSPPSFPFFDDDDDGVGYGNNSSVTPTTSSTSGTTPSPSSSNVPPELTGGDSESGSPLSFSFSSLRSRKNIGPRGMQTEELQALCRLTNGKPIPSMLRVTCRTTADRRLEWVDITCTNEEKISSMEWGRGLREYLSVLGVPSGEAMLSSNYFSFPHASVLDGCHCVFTRMATRYPSSEGQHSIQSLTNRLSIYILDAGAPAPAPDAEEPKVVAPARAPEKQSEPSTGTRAPLASFSLSSTLACAREKQMRRSVLGGRGWRRRTRKQLASFSSSPYSISQDLPPRLRDPSMSSRPTATPAMTSPGDRHPVHHPGAPLSSSGAMWKEMYEKSVHVRGSRSDVYSLRVPMGGTSGAEARAMQIGMHGGGVQHTAEHVANNNPKDSRRSSESIRKKTKRKKQQNKGGKKRKCNESIASSSSSSPLLSSSSSLSSEETPRRTLFITAHRAHLFCVHELHLEWEKKTKESQLLGALLYFFMKRVLGSYLHNLILCMVEFDGLETSVFRSDMDREVMTRKMYDIKRRVAVYERCLSLTRETYAHVVTALPTALKDHHFYELQHRMASAEGLAKDLSNDTESALELLFQWSSYEVNELMRFLTLFSAFFIPLNFITSIYGMNFEGLPFVDSPYGGWCLAGVFLFGIVGLLTWFRTRKFF